jgi:Ca2+-binding RTX toxin-like protein
VVLATGTIGGGSGGIISGTNGADHLNGRGGNDLLFGAGEADVLEGGEGDDSIEGGRGGDLLKGGNGEDTLSGGRGFDFLWGGRGADEFRFRPGEHADFITDFQSGIDSIVFDAASFGFDAATPVADVVQIGGPLPTEGATFVVRNDKILFDDDWSDAAGRALIAEVPAFLSESPAIGDFGLV